MPRFFISPSDVHDGVIILTGENARHISLSLRMSVGDRITACDQTATYDCVLTHFDGQTVEAEVVATRPVDTEPPYAAHLFQALPKGDKLDTVIQKAVECGVTDIIPFESSRCIVRAKHDTEARKTERRTRIAQEAAKQCGRGIIPAVKPTVTFDRMLEMAAEADLVLFCYEGEGALPLGAVLREAMPDASPDCFGGHAPHIAIIIGSEGGFSPEEAAAAEAKGFRLTGLGSRILRTETASAFVLGCLSYQYEL